MPAISLAKAREIVAAASAKGAELKLNPLSIAVLDAGGHLIAFERQDGASFARFEIASGKAYGALALGMGSRAVARTAIERPHFLTGVAGALGGRIVPVPGGVLVRGKDGALLGAVGITGDTSDNDEIAAAAGIEAAGFTADGG